MAKAVALDVDGTLMDANYLHVEARAFEEVGVRIPRVQVRKQIGKGSILLVKELVEHEEVAGKVKDLHGEIYCELRHHGFPLPGARELRVSS